MNPDDRLNRFFRNARLADCEVRQTGFETRLRANLRAEHQRRDSTLAWRLVPYFAAVALIAAVWYVVTPGPGPVDELAFLQTRSLSYLLAFD